MIDDATLARACAPQPGDSFICDGDRYTVDRVSRHYVFAHRNDHAPESLQPILLSEWPERVRNTIKAGAEFLPA